MHQVKQYTIEDEKLYENALELRDRLLRQPLGLSIYNEDISDERNQLHYMVFNVKKKRTSTWNC